MCGAYGQKMWGVCLTGDETNMLPPNKNIIMSKWVDVSWVSQRQVGLLGNNFPSYLPPQNVFPEYVFFGPFDIF